MAEQDGVVSVTSVYKGGGDHLVSFDGSQTFAVISLEGRDDEKVDALPNVVSVLRSSTVPVQIGGTTFTFDAVSDQVEDDLRRAELLSFGIVAVLLIIVFGSLVASLLPLIITGLSLTAFIPLTP